MKSPKSGERCQMYTPWFWAFCVLGQEKSRQERILTIQNCLSDTHLPNPEKIILNLRINLRNHWKIADIRECSNIRNSLLYLIGYCSMIRRQTVNRIRDGRHCQSNPDFSFNRQHPFPISGSVCFNLLSEFPMRISCLRTYVTIKDQNSRVFSVLKTNLTSN